MSHIEEDWRALIASQVLEMIQIANRKTVPTSLDEWEELTRHYLLDLTIRSDRGRAKGIVIDDVIVVREGDNELQTVQRIAHEVAEFLLVSDHSGPWVVPSSGSSDRHLIAQLVEKMITAAAINSSERESK